MDSSIKRFSYHVFLSHNRAQKDWVRSLARRLRDSGLRVFYDEDSIALGDDIVISIEQALRLSRHILLVLSPQALSSRWVALEWATTIYRDPDAAQRTIIPVLREECDIPLPLARLKRLDATGDDWDAQMQELLASIDKESVAFASTDSSPITRAKPLAGTKPEYLTAPGGALHRDSRVYIERQVDLELESRLLSDTGILGVYGCRQTGKSSLTVRALYKVAATRKVVRIDLSSLGVSDWEQLILAIAKRVAQAHNTAIPDLRRDDHLLPERFEEFLSALPDPTVVVLDEFDFIKVLPNNLWWLSFLRSWHDSSSYRRSSERGRVLFVTCCFLSFEDLTGEFASPFNVGAQLRLGNFSKEEVLSLLGVYQLKLDDRDISRLLRFTGGQPFLVHQCADFLHRGIKLADLITNESCYEERFGRHLLPLLESMKSVKGWYAPQFRLDEELKLQGPSALVELMSIGTRAADRNSLHHYWLFTKLGILRSVSSEWSRAVDRLLDRLGISYRNRDKVGFANDLYRRYFTR
jgi:hypothetical protein